MLYWEYYLMGIVLLPGILFAIIAQARVSSSFKKYGKIINMRGITGSEVARQILDSEDLHDVKVVRSTRGGLSDHYDPRKKIVALSEDVYSSSSVAALGVAAHEVGHAIQHKNFYFPAKLRSVLVPVTNLISNILWPLVFFGLFLNFGAEAGGSAGNIFITLGIVMFGASIVFNLVTLPVELNASKRAEQVLLRTNMVDEVEVDGAKKVLNAAALTYVAALLISILNLVRFLLVVRGRD